MTGHSISKGCIQQPHNEVWSGVGQGRAAAGPAWLFIEAFMLSYLQSKSKGANFTCPQQKETSSVNTIGYIDDNNLVINGADGNTQSKANAALNAWNDSLQMSGGALSTEKCEYYSTDWEWIQGSPKIINKELHLQTTDTTSPLARHDIAKAFKYLGIWFNPKGGWKKQYEICIAHAENFSGRIKASYLNTHEIHTAYSTIWRAKMRYILQHVWLTRNQCATI